MDLDLGDKPVANVTISGQVYKVDLPTVKQAQSFKEKIDSKATPEFDAFVEFMEQLGLPKNICESLSISQVSKLSEGLMGDPAKK